MTKNKIEKIENNDLKILNNIQLIYENILNEYNKFSMQFISLKDIEILDKISNQIVKIIEIKTKLKLIQNKLKNE